MLLWGDAVEARFGKEGPPRQEPSIVERVVYVDRKVPTPSTVESPVVSSLVYLATWEGHSVVLGVTGAPRQLFGDLNKRAWRFRVLVAVPGGVQEAREIRKKLKPYADGRSSYRDCPGVRAYAAGLRGKHPEWRSTVDAVAENRSGKRKGLPVVSELYCLTPEEAGDLVGLSYTEPDPGCTSEPGVCLHGDVERRPCGHPVESSACKLSCLEIERAASRTTLEDL